MQSIARNAMQGANRVRAALAAGKQSLGIFQMMPGPNVSRLLARTGVDWVVVDCEHGNIDDAQMHECVPAISAAGASPIVRIPDTQSWMVKRALDSGAHGIIVPLLRSVEEARQIVQSAKFPPAGRRGFGSSLPMQSFRSEPSMTEYLQEANDALLTIVQIETKEALEAVDQIAAVEGIDALFVGPFDLGNNIGYPITGSSPEPELENAIGKILAASQRAGKKCGIYATGGVQAGAFVTQGYDMVSLGSDYGALNLSVLEMLKVAKALPSGDHS